MSSRPRDQRPDPRLQQALELERAAAIHGDPVLRGRALILRAAVHFEEGDYPETRKAVQEAEALPLPPEEQLLVTATKASLLVSLGRRRDAVDAALALAHAHPDRDVGPRARVMAAELLVYDQGSQQEGVELLRQLTREGFLASPSVKEALVPIIEFVVSQELASPSFLSEVLSYATSDSGDLALLRGMVLLRQGRRDDAIEVFSAIAQNDSTVAQSMRALMGLLDALRPDEFHRLRPVCERLEARMRSGSNVRGLRAGLAFAMSRCAGTDLGWLERALAHARAALADDEAGFRDALQRLADDLEAHLNRLRRVAVPDDLLAWSKMHVPKDAAPGGSPAEVISAALAACVADEGDPFEALFAIDQVTMSLPPQYLECLNAAEGPGSMRAEFARAVIQVAKARRLRDRAPADCLPLCESLPGVANTDAERAVAHFVLGRELLESARYTHDTEIATARRARALGEVSNALTFAETAGASRATLASLRITLGNIHRESGRIDEALTVYEEAMPAVGNRSERARLDKVMADALVARARPGDVHRAVALYARALAGRPAGWLRAETLLALSKAHEADQETPEAQRLQQAHGALVEAARHDEGPNAEAIARRRLVLLSRWHRVAPEAEEPLTAIEELRAAFPQLADAADRAARGFEIGLDGATIHGVTMLLRHPAASIVMQCVARLPVSAEWTPDPSLLPAEISEEEARRTMQEVRITSRERAMQALADLPREASPGEVPGILVARALLLAAAHQLGAPTAVQLADARRAALGRLPPIAEEEVRGYLRGWLATAWTPGGGRGPDDDLPTTCAQLEIGLTECGPSSTFRADLLQKLAHFTWQRADGDRPRHLARGRALYEELLDLGRRLGAASIVTQALNGLAAVTTQSGLGAREQRLADGLAASAAAVEAAGGPARAPMAAANLAWDLTCLAARAPKAERLELLERACGFFEAALKNLDDSSIPLSIRSNRTVARASLLVELGRLGDAIALDRAFLRSIDRARNPAEWATAAHNFAIDLGKVGTREAWHEAQKLYAAALEHRSIERFPREHWETALASGEMYRGLLAFEDVQRVANELKTTEASLRSSAIKRFRSAVSAGRRLGRGAELFDAGNALLDLASTATSANTILETSEEGWNAVLDALPGMLQHEESGARIAGSALDVADALFCAEASRSVLVVDPRVTAALTGESAIQVLRWMDRSVGVVQRSLALRLDRPDGVSDDRWRRWHDVLRAGNALAIAEVAEEIRQTLPSFLRLEESLEMTWKWLEDHDDSAALLPLRLEDAWLVGVLCVRDSRRDARVFRIVVDNVEFDTGRLWDKLRHQQLDAEGSRAVDGLATVVRTVCDAALRWSTGGVPQHLLWVPTEVLRWLPPQRVWPGQRVSTAASLALRPPSAPPSLKRDVLLVAADPGDLPGSVEGVLDLAHAAVADNVRVLVGRQARWGRALAPDATGVADLPPSPDEVLDALGGAGLAVLLCHGRAERPGDGRLQLLDHKGAEAWLDVEDLTSTVGRLRECTILLLSCETGRAAPTQHAVGGLAGALLAAGARAVVAPLVPVSLSIALELAANVTRTRSLDDLPALVAALREGVTTPESATLGRRTPRSDAASPEGRWQRESFILWVA